MSGSFTFARFEDVGAEVSCQHSSSVKSRRACVILDVGSREEHKEHLGNRLEEKRSLELAVR